MAGETAPPRTHLPNLSSKVFNPVGEGPNHRGLSRLHILRQIDASLRRLGVDYLDIYLIHEPDPETPLEETLGALDDLVRQGKVRYVGASNMPAWLMAQSLRISDGRRLQHFMKILILSHAEVERLLPIKACVEVMAEALAALSRGEIHQPLRTVVRPPEAAGLMGLMPAYRAGERPSYGLKAVCVFPGNTALGKDAHQGSRCSAARPVSSSR